MNRLNLTDSLTPWFLTAYVREVWRRLGSAGPSGAPLPIAIFGAGAHSRWLECITGGVTPAPRVVAVLDDHPGAESFWGVRPARPETWDTAPAAAILISSDTCPARLRERCQAVFGDRLSIIALYSGFPPGPYPKKAADVIAFDAAFRPGPEAIEAALRREAARFKNAPHCFVGGAFRSGKTVFARMLARQTGHPFISFDEAFPAAVNDPGQHSAVLAALDPRSEFVTDSIPANASNCATFNAWRQARSVAVVCVFCPDLDEWVRRLLATWYFKEVVRHMEMHCQRARDFYFGTIPALEPAGVIYYDSLANEFVTCAEYVRRMEWLKS